MSETLLQATLSQLRGHRHRFTPALPGLIGRDAGLYALWVGCCCLYVGMSTNIGSRLYQHRVQQHNDRLALYLKAFWKDVEASVAPLPNRSAAHIRSLEQEAIRALRPRTNIAIPKAS